jgi:hypothetical protein
MKTISRRRAFGILMILFPGNQTELQDILVNGSDSIPAHQVTLLTKYLAYANKVEIKRYKFQAF